MASLNALRAEAEAWLEELGRVRAAAAPEVADLAQVDRDHAEVVSAETARAVSALLASARVPEPEQPRLRLLVRFLEDATLQSAAREARTTLDRARWRVEAESGLDASLAEAEAELPRAAERATRLKRESAVDRGWEALLAQVQRVQAELARAASALGAGSIPALREARREPDWPVLDTEAFLRTTEDAYRDVLGWALGRVAPGLAPLPRGDATLADLDRVRSLPGYAGALAQAGGALRDWAARLPEGEARSRRLRIRTVPAAAAGLIDIEVPDELVLLVPGSGPEGADAPEQLFLTGCALHLASVESDAPVEHRRMGDPTVVASSGWLVRSLLWHERWLRGALSLGKATAREVARMEGLVALATLRAEAALAPHLATLAGEGLTPRRLGEAADALSAALRTRVGRGRALAMAAALDVTRRTLRAAALSSCLWAEADRRFDADEFRNPVAARWLVALWSRGAPEPPEQMAPALSGSPLGLERLRTELVSVLGA